MKIFKLTSFLIIAFALSACSSIGKEQNKFTYFHQQDDFDIAKISHYNIGIVGIIDDTNTLTPVEKEQFTYAAYQSFVNEVEDDNLFTTEDLVADIGIKNYQKVYSAAKVNDTASISQLISGLAVENSTSRYLLIMRLTEVRDLYKEGYYDQNSFFSNSSCNSSGWALGLTMTIIDTQNGTEVWGGHLNKKDKQEYCNDNDDYDDIHHGRHHRIDKHDKDSFWAGLLVLLAVAVIAEELSDDEPKEANSNEKLSLFRATVNEFSQELPSFYFN